MWRMTANKPKNLTRMSLAAALLLLASSSARADEVIGNLRLNLRGQILADITLAPRSAAQDGDVKVEFTYGDVTQTINAGRFPANVNVKRVISTPQPFPCDRTLDVRATITSPHAFAGQNVMTSLTRRCSRTQGTPDLTVKLEQASTEVVQRETRVRLKVAIKNSSAYNMPDNAQGGKLFSVQIPNSSLAPVTDMSRNTVTQDAGPAGTYTVRRALQAGEENSFDIYVAVPCNQKAIIEARVDFPNVILESNEDNNTFKLELQGKPCQDARLILPQNTLSPFSNSRLV